MLNAKDIEWSKENLPEMSSAEMESTEPPRKKVARPEKVTIILINSYYYFYTYSKAQRQAEITVKSLTFFSLVYIIDTTLEIISHAQALESCIQCNIIVNTVGLLFSGT